ncbi:MAG TPA: acyl-CoA dehydrogenase family protein [Polyangiaceae bacterium]|nr:acyl-CoA dehydrogenase family protein [Polyangiaceae bacterium]
MTKIDRIIEALTPELAASSAKHDVEGSFVEPGYRLLKEHGFFGAAVPEALGGLGASHRELCDALRRLAHACPATALAASMHSHLVAATVYKHLRGQGGEPLLRRVAAEQLVLVSTGAGDWFESNGKLERVEGGFRLTAKKQFCSGAPAGDLLITSSVFEDPSEGPQVLHFPVSLKAQGVTIGDDWDSLGMRGTGSHTVALEGVFVPEASVALRRPRSGWHPAWSVVLTVAPPIYMSPYLGIAEAARERALKLARARVRSETALLAGELENALLAAQLAWEKLVNNASGYDFSPEPLRANSALMAKTLLTKALLECVDKAMELAGGAGYFRRAGIERLLRDVRGAHYHPLPEKQQQLLTGRFALGLDPLA